MTSLGDASLSSLPRDTLDTIFCALAMYELDNSRRHLLNCLTLSKRLRSSVQLALHRYITVYVQQEPGVRLLRGYLRKNEEAGRQCRRLVVKVRPSRRAGAMEAPWKEITYIVAGIIEACPNVSTLGLHYIPPMLIRMLCSSAPPLREVAFYAQTWSGGLDVDSNIQKMFAEGGAWRPTLRHLTLPDWTPDVEFLVLPPRLVSLSLRIYDGEKDEGQPVFEDNMLGRAGTAIEHLRLDFAMVEDSYGRLFSILALLGRQLLVLDIVNFEDGAQQRIDFSRLTPNLRVSVFPLSCLLPSR